MEQDEEFFVRKYIGQVNSELQTKVLENCNLKAQIEVANERIASLADQLEKARATLKDSPGPVDEKPDLHTVE